MLNVFVPDPPSRPQIYPPSHPPATALPPALATLAGRPRPGKARRHWTITRTPPSRSRLKDAENEEESGQSKTTVLGDALPGDWGAFAVVLQDDGRAEADVAGIGPAGSGNATKNGSGGGGGGGSRNRNDDKFWTDEAAQKARDYLIDIVYGGQRGYAYVRSIAEFISRPCEVDDVDVIRVCFLLLFRCSPFVMTFFATRLTISNDRPARALTSHPQQMECRSKCHSPCMSRHISSIELHTDDTRFSATFST